MIHLCYNSIKMVVRNPWGVRSEQLWDLTLNLVMPRGPDPSLLLRMTGCADRMTVVQRFVILSNSEGSGQGVLLNHRKLQLPIPMRI